MTMFLQAILRLEWLPYNHWEAEATWEHVQPARPLTPFAANGGPCDRCQSLDDPLNTGHCPFEEAVAPGGVPGTEKAGEY